MSVGLTARPLMTMTSNPDSLKDALNGPSTWVSPIPFVSGLFAQTARDASPTYGCPAITEEAKISAFSGPSGSAPAGVSRSNLSAANKPPPPNVRQ